MRKILVRVSRMAEQRLYFRKQALFFMIRMIFILPFAIGIYLLIGSLFFRKEKVGATTVFKIIGWPLVLIDRIFNR